MKKSTILLIKRLIIWGKLEQVRTCIGINQKDFYKYLNNFLNKKKYNSVIMHGSVSSLYGIFAQGIVTIVADEKFKGTLTSRIRQKWNKLPLNTRRLIVLGAAAGAATSLVLITTILAPVESTRGGLNPELFQLVKRAKKMHLLRLAVGLREPLVLDICGHIIHYASTHRYAPGFIPPSPFDVNYGVINQSIYMLSHLILNSRKFEMSDTAVWVLVNLCKGTTFQ